MKYCFFFGNKNEKHKQVELYRLSDLLAEAFSTACFPPI